METLHLPSFAKVNLGLQVIRRRSDGYHELRTIFQTIDLHDELVFEPASRGVELECRGLSLSAGEENLAMRAARALEKTVPVKRGVRILLTKRIPIGAGLGGGSSNAAATLAGLNRFWSLNLPEQELMKLARDLGADVPFFLKGGAAFGTGRGDRIRSLSGSLNRFLLLVCPPVRLSTRRVFEAGGFGLTGKKPRIRMMSFSQALSGRGDLADLILNDLERPAFRLCPEIRSLLRRLREVGAEAVSMTGSGPCTFGLFPRRQDAERALDCFRADRFFREVCAPLSRLEFRG